MPVFTQSYPSTPENRNKSILTQILHTHTLIFQISRLASVCETAGPGSFTTSSDLQQLPPVLCPFHQQRLRRPWTDKAAKMCCANSFHLWRWADTRRKSRWEYCKVIIQQHKLSCLYIYLQKCLNTQYVYLSELSWLSIFKILAQITPTIPTHGVHSIHGFAGMILLVDITS